VASKLQVEDVAPASCVEDVQQVKQACDSVIRVLEALMQFDKVRDGTLKVELSPQPLLPIVEQTIASFATMVSP
jgi:hypothetical protein